MSVPPMRAASIVSMLAGYFLGAVLDLVLFWTVLGAWHDAPPRWAIALVLAGFVVVALVATRLAVRAFNARPGFLTGLAAGVAVGFLSASVVAAIVVPILWLTFGNGPGFYVG